MFKLLSFFKKKDPPVITYNKELVYRLQQFYYHKDIVNILEKSDAKLMLLNTYTENLNNLYSAVYHNSSLDILMAVNVYNYFKGMSSDGITYILGKLIKHISENKLPAKIENDLSEILGVLEYLSKGNSNVN